MGGMTHRSRLLAAYLVLAGCKDAGETPDRAAVEPPTSAPLQLKIGSYNVFYGNAEAATAERAGFADPDTVNQAGLLGADVLALQETNGGFESALRQRLARELPHCRFHPPTRLLPGGIGLCSRYPIVKDELLDSPVGWFPAQRSLVSTPRGPLQVLNVHLKPAVADQAEWWSVHRSTRVDRDREIKGLHASLAHDVPTIIVGDFNDVVEGDLFATLSSLGFDNAFRERPTAETSWRWLGAEPPLAALLDHVAYQRDHLRLVDASVLAGGRSDHLAVVVSLEL